jgi:hypothetical protein
VTSDNFAVFILSHGRPNNVKTYSALRKCGYTGKIYILIDNEDKHQTAYKDQYGDQVIVFNKKESAKITDAGDNFGKRNSVLYARNQNFVIAKKMGLTHFWQLDDDYSGFGWVTNNDGSYRTADTLTKCLDQILESLIIFLDDSGAHCVAMAQGGDMIGGGEGTVVKKIRQGKFLRKVMNSFLFSTDRPLKFYGRMNDDVNMFIANGNRGMLFITVPRLRLWQAETQANEGGLTEMYLEAGTYVKSFYTVMYAPYCTTISPMGSVHKRLHHKIKWKNAVPQIISDQYKKVAS